MSDRPSEFRLVVLSNFMAYLDTVMFEVESHVFRYSKHVDSRQKYKNDHARAVWILMKDVNIFSDDNSQRKLKNIFDPNAKDLPNENRLDLLNMSEIGNSRMKTYIKQYAFSPPIETPKKRILRKIRTFSKANVTIQKEKGKFSRLAKVMKGLTKQLQNSGMFYDKVLEFPYAISSEYGEMRDRCKSNFKNALMETGTLASMFKPINPISLTKDSKTEVIFDFLRYLHSPPRSYI
jgi:hypothetical protein